MQYTCKFCNGRGTQASGLICISCRGRGSFDITEKTTSCSSCKGTGRATIKTLACISCGGKGFAVLAEKPATMLPEIPEKDVLIKEEPKMTKRIKSMKKEPPKAKKKPMESKEFGEEHLEDLKKSLTEILDSPFLS